MSCSRTQRSASGEARTRNPSIFGQALYHDCAPQLGSILCRYDTCPTQYAPDLRGSILCMQGTQYAPRESILCMEHFVALQCMYSLMLNEQLKFDYYTGLFTGYKVSLYIVHGSNRPPYSSYTSSFQCQQSVTLKEGYWRWSHIRMKFRQNLRLQYLPFNSRKSFNQKMGII